MIELCAWDLDGTIRPGTLLGDAVQHGATAGFIDLALFKDPVNPSYDEIGYFVHALKQQPRKAFDDLTDRLTDEAVSQSYPWAIDELCSQTGDQYPVIFCNSPDFLVRAFAKGLPNVRQGRGSYFHTKASVFTGRASTLSKARAIRRYQQNHDATVAFAAGGTLNDVVMLNMAERAVVVNPDELMTQLASENNWEIVQTQQQSIKN